MQLTQNDPMPSFPCEQEGCEKTAGHIIYWPGRKVLFCPACTERAQNIAVHMGFKLEVLPIYESKDGVVFCNLMR